MPSFLDVAVEIAQEAGSLLVHYFEKRIGYELKAEFDLVTEADHASEKLIVERLRNYFPSHSIVAEEGGGHESSSEYRWYVDPLDGTTNFAHGFPMFNVTLALEQNGEMIGGVIYDPLRRELFTADRGGGAYLNNRRIRVSAVSSLSLALVATGFPSAKRHTNVNVYFYHQLAMLSHGVRRGGSAALDLAYVAAGRLEAFWEIGLQPWDMAAGSLIVREAGGKVTDMAGGAHSMGSAQILADNGLIHEETLELFRDIFAGRYRVPIPPISS